MNQNEIMAMAREAGFEMSHLPSIRAANVYGEVNDELALFAALVAAKEREACAQLCDEQFEKSTTAAGAFRADMCAAAIRARVTKEGV